MPKKIVLIKIVLIKWVDAKFCSGIHTEREAREHDMSIFESVGYLISKTELATIIACECNNDDEYRSLTIIPTGSIQTMNKLELVSPVLPEGVRYTIPRRRIVSHPRRKRRAGKREVPTSLMRIKV